MMEREKKKHIRLGIAEHRRCEGERENYGEGGLRGDRDGREGDRRRTWERITNTKDI